MVGDTLAADSLFSAWLIAAVAAFQIFLFLAFHRFCHCSENLLSGDGWVGVVTFCRKTTVVIERLAMM
jgi:hypothetical protein